MSCSCQAAKLSLPPSQNRSCLSPRTYLPLSFSAPLSPSLAFLLTSPVSVASAPPYTAAEASGHPQETHRAWKWSWPVLDPACVFTEATELECTAAAQFIGGVRLVVVGNAVRVTPGSQMNMKVFICVFWLDCITDGSHLKGRVKGEKNWKYLQDICAFRLKTTQHVDILLAFQHLVETTHTHLAIGIHLHILI